MFPRKSRHLEFPLSLLLVLLCCLPVLAAEETYQIDPVHSSVNFTIRHLVGRVQGRFAKFSGTIQIDQANPATAKVSAEIEVGSVDTGVGGRDNDLRSDHFFDAAKYPKITYESTGVTVRATDKVTLSGNLTMHGVTKPVTLEVTGLGFGPGMRGEYRAGFEAHGSLHRKDFGIVYGLSDTAKIVVGDEVDITILVEAVKTEPAPAAVAPGAKPTSN